MSARHSSGTAGGIITTRLAAFVSRTIARKRIGVTTSDSGMPARMTTSTTSAESRQVRRRCRACSSKKLVRSAGPATGCHGPGPADRRVEGRRRPPHGTVARRPVDGLIVRQFAAPPGHGSPPRRRAYGLTVMAPGTWGSTSRSGVASGSTSNTTPSGAPMPTRT